MNLYIEFNKLKEQLLKKVYLMLNIKRLIPKIPKSIGVITSETGAVIRDIINVIKRRYPKVNIKLYPVKVQGQQSKYDICEHTSVQLPGCQNLLTGQQVRWNRHSSP